MPRAATLVLDASAAAELVLDDAGAYPVGIALRDALNAGMRVVGPTALLSEVQAAVTKRVRRHALDVEGGRLACEFWRSLIERMPIEIGEEYDHHQAAYAMSAALGHAYYDCLYLSLAKLQGAELLTCDPVLARKATERGITCIMPVLSVV